MFRHRDRHRNATLNVFLSLAVSSLVFGLLIFFVPALQIFRNHVADAAAVVCLFSCLAVFVNNTLMIAAITLAVALSLELLQASGAVTNSSLGSDFVLGHTFDVIDVGVYVGTAFLLSWLHRTLAKG